MRRDETRASQSFFDKEEKKKQNKNVRLLLNFSLRSTVKTARLTSDRINRVCKLGISFWLVESLCSLLAFAGMLKISIFPSPTREMCSLCGVVELNLLELCCESWLYRRKFRLQILHFHFSSSARCEPFCCNFSWLALCVLCSNLHRQIVRISVTEKNSTFPIIFQWKIDLNICECLLHVAQNTLGNRLLRKISTLFFVLIFYHYFFFFFSFI